MNIQVRQQKRKSFAFRLTPDGATVLVPYTVAPDSHQIEAFVAEALAKLPPESDEAPTLQPDDIYNLVEDWQERLKVSVARLQIRTMRNKWGSVSTAGTLTLAAELLNIPYDLVEYVVVHELLHLKFPDHRKGWQVSMGMYLSNWREREYRLQRYIPLRSVYP